MQILSTKLSIPPLRSRLITRPRLIQKLNQGLDCGYILVSAPAGYGKTTLLSSWLSRLDLPSAWLSLDESDDEPNRFLAYLVAAFQILDPSIEKIFEASATINTEGTAETVITTLINHLSQRSSSCCLVLDDYHVIQNQAVHKTVSFLLEHLPSTLKLVIATRADPPLPLARLRARSCLVELRLADLRFTLHEAVDFLHHTMGIKISEDDIARLNARTEGWIAGLQIAGLSMQNSDDIPGFIRTLSGSHHYIFDYLLEEILGKQPIEVQRFLLYTSILDQLTGPLCDSLLDGGEASPSAASSTEMLQRLEHANLFIIPLDNEQCWYRYHPLFTELLRGYLAKKEPGQLQILHTRASNWYEAQGLIADAIRHSLAACDWERIIRLISANIFALLEQNELNHVSRQIANLTGEDNPARPWLLMGHAWLAAYTGQLDSVEPILKRAEGEIDRLRSEQELQTLGGHTAAIRAYVNWIGVNWKLAESAARVALEWLPENEYLIRCQAASILGLSLLDLDAGGLAFEQAIAYAKKTTASHVTIFAYASWAWLLAMQSKLHASLAVCQDTIRMAQSSASLHSLPTLSHAYTTLSFLLYEWNDLEGALQYSKEAVSLARRWEQVDALHFALSYQAYAYLASGAVREAYDAIRQALQIANSTSLWFKHITISQEIDMYLDQDNLDAAQECARQAGLDDLDPAEITFHSFKSGYMAMMVIRLFVAQKKYKQALLMIDRVLEEMEKRKLWNYIIRTLNWQAMAYQGLRQDELALATLKRALAMAYPEGYVRTFTHEGHKLVPLLKQAFAAGIYPEYVEKLLKLCVLNGSPSDDQAITASTLIDPLSKREMDVLQLLAQGFNDKKIAENLVIARETVHKHLKNIYGKLDVHSRTEAISRARQLNLL